MSWFRKQGGWGAWLALIALTLQLGLSFGHVHAHAGAPASFSVAQTTSYDGDHTGAPDRDEAGYCATCALLSLLAGAQASDVPQELAALTPAASLLAMAELAVPTTTADLAFRSRAPPRS